MNAENHAPEINWAASTSEVETLARLFVDHTDTSYISHGEVIDGRAQDLSHWIPDLLAFMIREFSTVLEKPDQGRYFRLAKLSLGGKSAGLAFLTIDPEPGIAILQDMVIDKSIRGKNLGHTFMVWLEHELKAMGIKRIFLESGIHNERAHHFFHAQGFETSSVVMSKTI